jgi:D-arabinose 1-dehydrogenase-like Zn-dependent alcohol dehydrogenase
VSFQTGPVVAFQTKPPATTEMISPGDQESIAPRIMLCDICDYRRSGSEQLCPSTEDTRKSNGLNCDKEDLDGVWEELGKGEPCPQK